MDGRPNGSRPGTLSRRRFLAAAASIPPTVSIFGLGGCGDGGRGTSAELGVFDIPDPATELPAGDVTVRVLATPDNHPDFWAAFGAAYQEKHPNISVDYEGFPVPRILEVLPLAIRNGSAHDVFLLPGALAREGIEDGWVHPLDDIIPDFEDWKSAFPEGAFVPGVHEFDGRTYTMPLGTQKVERTLLLFNPALLEEAGVELTATPGWGEFREVAKKVTSHGDGQYYGFAMPGVRLMNTVRRLAYTAGAIGSRDFDARTGRHIAGSEEYREAVELLLAMQDDGSLFPGSLSMTAQEAPPRVLSGNVAMILDGSWTAENWERDDPDFRFGVTGLPIADVAEPTPGMADDPGGGYWVYSGSQWPEVVGDMLSYAGSIEGQVAGAEIRGVTFPSVFAEARDALREVVSENGARIMDLNEQVIIPPYPEIRNPDVLIVHEEFRPPQPGPAQLLEAIMVGDVADVGQALRDLGDSFDQALDDAIDAARGRGADVSRDDWVFPNFDPARDYGGDDYAAL